MPRILEASEIDTLNEEVDLQLDVAEQRVPPVTQVVGDLTDGGIINGVRVTPMRDGKVLAMGRAVVRRAWMWNGTESMLPLGWNPAGTRHDGARPYLLKRYCLCCHYAGFRGQQCSECVKKSCSTCRSSSDTQHVQMLSDGRVIKGWIIPAFYLSKEQVPFPSVFYGSINCFLGSCIRREDRGFRTEQDMRLHARSRHGREYQAYQETLTATKEGEMESLRQRIDELMLTQSRLQVTTDGDRVQPGIQSKQRGRRRSTAKKSTD